MCNRKNILGASKVAYLAFFLCSAYNNYNNAVNCLKHNKYIEN